MRQDRYDEAELLWQRALAASEQQVGLEHPDTAQCLNNLASLYTIQGKYTEAEKLLKRALIICEQQLETQDSYTVMMRENYTTLLKAMKGGS